MKRGHTQTTTRKPDNFYGGKALVLAQDATQGGHGGLQHELYRQMWGQLMTGDPQLNAKALDDVEYMQNIDLTRTYENRSFEVVGDAITALVHNEKNNFLITVVAPIFLTDELNFHSHRKEWNQIEYTRVSETGLGEETSFSQWNWTDKLERRKQEAKLSMELSLDNNYGATVWAENLAALASDALLTLMKEAAYAVYTIGYSNAVEDKIRQIPVDLSRLYRWEAQSFFCCAMGLDGFLQRIQDCGDTVPNYDTVIMPYKTSHRLREMTGESKPVDAVIVSMNPQTQEYERQLSAGPQTVKTVSLGNKRVNFYEQSGFMVNTRDGTIEDPSVGRATLCQCLPPNHDVHAEDDVHGDCVRSSRSLDMIAFYQQKEVGEDRRIPFKEMVKNCFAYDPVTGKPSQYVRRLEKEKNNIDEKNRAPYAFNAYKNKGYVAEDINDEDQNYDYATPDAQALGHQQLLEEMTSWRHDCFLLTWDPAQGRYRIPQRIGDFHLSAMPHKWLLRAVRQLESGFSHASGISLSNALANLRELVDEINSEPFTVDYATALIDAQLPFLRPDDRRYPTNEYGALRLPSNADGALSGMVFPPGYGFGGGIQTLAREATRAGSNWQEAGRRARAVVKDLEQVQSYLRQSLGKSDVTDDSYAAFPSGDSSLTGLVNAALGRADTVYMGVPGSVTRGAGDDVTVRSGAGRVAAATGPQPLGTVLDALANAGDAGGVLAVLADPNMRILPNEGLRALLSLNPVAIERTKAELLAAIGGGGAMSAERRGVYDSLFKVILAMVPFTGTFRADTTNLASALATEVVSLVAAGSTKEAGELLGKAHNRKAMQEKGKEWGQSAEFRPVFTADASDDIRAALKEAERRTTAGGETTVVGEARTVASARARAGGDARTVSFAEGDYSLPPRTYLQAPLAANESLEALVARGFNWIVPSHPITDEAMGSTEDLARRDQEIKKGRKNLQGLSRLNGAWAFHASARKSQTGGDMDVEGGSSYGGMRMDARAVGRGHMASASRLAPVDPDDEGVTDEFFGPWRERLRFASTLESDAQQMLFLALIQSRNTLDIHMRLADYGAQVMNVVLFRPWIECTAKSVVVMEAGTNTMLTAMSRAKAIVSKEDRGIFHIGSSFYTGTVRVNPGNIELIPLCDPDRFLGGKNHSFVTHPEQWSMENPLKPSIIALPVPVNERVYGPYVEMTNQQLYLRPGIDVDGHFCKYSSAEFYRSIFLRDRVDTVQAAHQQRTKYWSYVDVSHVGHVGPRSFIDARTGLQIDYNGHGPGNDRRMNMPGAEKVWNGQASEFPQLVPSYMTRARGNM